MTGWRCLQDDPPWAAFGTPLYEVIEWQRVGDIGEPRVANVEEVSRDKTWNVADVWWRPVM